MKQRFRRFVDKVRMGFASTPDWVDVMVLADQVEQDPVAAEPQGRLRRMVDAEIRRRNGLYA